MDPLRLLSRSTKLSRNSRAGSTKQLPSSGHNPTPQLFSTIEDSELRSPIEPRKRKRNASTDNLTSIEFFRQNSSTKAPEPRGETGSVAEDGEPVAEISVKKMRKASPETPPLTLDERKGTLKKHKLKITWLNPPSQKQKNRRKAKAKGANRDTNEKQEKPSLFPNAFESFHSLRSQYETNNKLSSNVDDQGYTIPTEVQIGALPLLLGDSQSYLHECGTCQLPDESQGIDLMTVAPTGSGKTLAFLLPLVHGISKHKRAQSEATKLSVAIILAPTKELAGQIVNEGKKLAAGTGVRISQVRKGTQLVIRSSSDIPDEDESDSDIHMKAQPVVKADILVSTPGILESIIRTASEHDQQPLSSVRHLILDEADVLLDPLFREQTLAIWNTLTCPSLRVSLWSATMGSSIEELAQAQINERRAAIAKVTGTDPPEAPLIRLVVGLKDSAVPNVQHRLVYAASEQGKLLSLRQILRPTSSAKDHHNPAADASSQPLIPPFLVFTQTIDRAVALHAELRYDIPAEAGGAARIAVLHAGLSDAARDRVMAGFRRADIWVLITTDLLSRGVDFRGVNAVINYDLPTSSAAYVHRVGRTGRAGRKGGVAITLYTKDDIPYLKNVANVVALAQKQRGNAGGDAGDREDRADGVQQWLLDALPSLSKKAKQGLKKRGVESRTARGREKDPKAGRRARISTKAGFVRREENKRKGAIAGSQRRQAEEQAAGEASGSDFDGFDE